MKEVNGLKQRRVSRRAFIGGVTALLGAAGAQTEAFGRVSSSPQGQDYQLFLPFVTAGWKPSGIAPSLGGAGGTVLVAASNANAKVKAQADYVCDGIDDQVEILAAVDALSSTGGRVVFSEGLFNISANILITQPNIVLSGAGWSTVLRSVAADYIFLVLADNVTGCNLTLDGNGIAGSGVTCVKSDFFSVYGCYVKNTLGNGISSRGSSLGAPCRYVSIQNNFLDNCVSSIALDFENRFVVVSGNVINNGHGALAGGISVDALNGAFGTEYLVISGNHVDVDSIGIAVVNTHSCAITGNVVRCREGGPIGLLVAGLSRSVVSANVLYGPGSGVAVDMANAQDVLTTGNRVYGWGTGIYLDANSRRDYIVGNHLTSVATPITVAGPGHTIRNNKGFVTENSGTATIPNGATSVIVYHGLGIVPALRDIMVTPTNSLGNAAKFWVSDPKDTQFTINVEADPGPTTATFAWQVVAL